MTRGQFFKRLLLVVATIDMAAIVAGVKTVTVATAPPPPSRSVAQISMDSLRALAILDPKEPVNPYIQHLDTMPPGGRRLAVDRTIVHGREFNDSNRYHIAAASLLGIDPIDTEADILNISRPIVKVSSNPEYYIDDLTHSLPYLVPEAEELLHDIGKAFRDSLQARGGGDYRIKVTSILRTNSSVKSLRRRNRNAIGGSAHLYGTTFDISYSNFICNSDSVPRTVEDMKMLLAEILKFFRDNDRCFVKHERKQSCFHITTRPTQQREDDLTADEAIS
ncbi:MAG: hypothetical protein K2G40_08265 [Muribaculaceae bacterium]|nr:hypothetical protein [Muribaculaceae bacterium]